MSEIISQSIQRTVGTKRIKRNSVPIGINSAYGVPWCLNLYIEGIDADELAMSCEDLTFSTGSSCNSQDTEPSHVLKACGYDDEYIRSCIRLSFNPFNYKEGSGLPLFVAESLAKTIDKLDKSNGK
jgi:cysteine sulfinate desulfinase/cysteine desulfurase-like protein